MKQAKFYGKIYEVKETGKTYRKPAKSYADFNGYDTDRPSSSRKGLGLYDENGNKAFSVSQDGRVFDGTKQIGSVKITEAI